VTIQNVLGSESEAQRPIRQSQRLDAITEVVLAAGNVKIEELIELFKVSAMTIHRDLDILDSQGVIRKSRGLATAVATSLFEANPDFRKRQNVEIKQRIALKAFELVEPGQAIILDDSTTLIHLAKLLHQKIPLTVISNFEQVIDVIKHEPGITVVSLGGNYAPWSNAYLGSLTVNALKAIRADILFMSTPSIIDDICFHQHHESAVIKQAMFESSQKRVLVADHTKFDQRAVHSTMKLKDFDTIILDAKTPLNHLERLRRSNIDITLAK
jgi:DeoR/GlpR family transcriptional regulator of sugar metabolism